MSTGTSAEFFTAFQSARREIDDDLKRSSTVQGETVTKLQSLKADLARHIASLPAYDQRSCTLQLNELEAKVSAARNQAKPKSRFAFARSTAASAAPSSSSSISTGATPTPDDPLTGGSGPSASGSTTAPSPLPSSPASRPDNVPTTDSDDTEVSWTDVRCGLLRLPSISTKVCISLSNISDSIIDFRTSQAVTASTSIGPSAPGTPGRAGADSETVGLAAIPGPLRARDEWTRGITSLHVQGLKRCILIAGVEGSAILHGLEDCLVVVASHQFRIHSSHRTAILLHTPSVPIIEHSDTLYFGALPSHLRKESNNSQHEKVQDFDWVKGGPSPNWRALGSTASEMLFPRDEADVIGALTHDEVGDAVERMVGSIADLVPIDPSA